MSDSSEFRHFGAAEFPNDNPSLHDGAIWVCFAPRGPLRPVVRPRPRGRSSTIPDPVVTPARPVAPEASAEGGCPAEPETPITEVASLCGAAEESESPLPPLDLDLTPAAAAHGMPPGPLDLDPDEPSSPEGCSLSAGLRPEDVPAENDAKVSELREKANLDVTGVAPIATPAESDRAPVNEIGEGEPRVASAFALAPVDVECTPSEAIVGSVDAVVLDEDDDERKTILPPPSEEAPERTLTLAKIRVAGRGQTAPDAPASMHSPSVDAAPAEQTVPLAVAEAPAPDPFAAFVAALVEVALTSGATRAAAVVPGFLDGAAQDSSGFSEGVRASLVSSAVALEQGGTLKPTVVLLETASAWRMVLRGESNDFSACGTSTLDGWAADLLRAFGVGKDGKVDVRRELRRRGVAAFGMILAA